MDTRAVTDDHDGATSSPEAEDDRCPHCGSTQITRSRSKGAWNGLLTVIGLTQFRCRVCDLHFRKRTGGQ